MHWNSCHIAQPAGSRWPSALPTFQGSRIEPLLKGEVPAEQAEGFGNAEFGNFDLWFPNSSLVSVLSQVLTRAGREDIATLTTLAGLVVVLLMVVNLIGEFFTSVQAIFNLY